MRSFERDLTAERTERDTFEDPLRHNFTRRVAAERARMDRESESALAKVERALQPKEAPYDGR